MNVHETITAALRDRSVWEDKARAWWTMTVSGMRRRNKANWMADTFWPLISESIGKLTPFYYQQAFASEQLANFVALSPELQGASDAAAGYLDWQMRQDQDIDDSGEFEQSLLLTIWMMLVYGRGLLSVYWDVLNQRVRYESVHPLSLIVPRCDKLTEADAFARVRTMTVGQYQRDRRYLQNPEVINRIKGQGEPEHNQLERDKAQREGITWSRESDKIIVWDAYERTPGGWTVKTYSPAAPEIPLRRPFGIADKWRGKPFLPFVSFVMEIIEGGWYAPRGVAERLAPFQQWLCKTWNEKADAMTFWNRPLFTNGGTLPNTANVAWQPGDFVPGDISAVQMPSPPLSFDSEMAMTRQVASETIQMPDAGVSSDVTDSLPSRGGNPTATEIDYRKQLAATGVDLRGRLFRLGLGQVYRKNWALLVAHKAKELSYYVAGERKTLPGEALVENYMISPAGSPDYWNKSQKVQRALMRLQTLMGNPNVRQDELTKDFIAADSADLVKRLWIPTGQKDADEVEDEQIEIEALLMNGSVAQINAAENHAVRIRVLFQKLQALSQLGAPVNPLAQQRIFEHIVGHLNYLMQQNPALARKIQTAASVLEGGAGPTGGAPRQAPEQPPIQPQQEAVA